MNDFNQVKLTSSVRAKKTQRSTSVDIHLKGSPLPFGASQTENGINFSLYCAEAKEVSICFFSEISHQLTHEIQLNPKKNKTGDVWHILFPTLEHNLYYAYRIKTNSTGKTAPYLLDPYAKELSTPNQWGSCCILEGHPSEQYQPLGHLPLNIPFNWESIQAPHIPKEQLIIYEMHVRAFTFHPSSHAFAPGTFAAILEKIPYLLNLGINAIELMPIFEFNENEYQKTDPLTGRTLYNFWGYSPVNFFSPTNRYATDEKRTGAINEFKTLVREMHRHGIEVILDVVYNHTCEGSEQDYAVSLRGIEPTTYFLTDNNLTMKNHTGCGNTLNCNHPVVIKLILDSLHYWATEMRVDGFRFDLASTFYRDSQGMPLEKSPLIEALSTDPILAEKKLIAEPWDADGLYHLGRFYPEKPRWSEWNGAFRDTVRQFIKGDDGKKGEFAKRITGSSDLFGHLTPATSINFLTCHDGFTLQDLVCYNDKKNENNGEENRDGCNHNNSWNCGIEGESDDPSILALRERQKKNLHLALMISHGIPMLLMGDEYGHTRKGNNNSWCQDNALNWFLWDELKKNNGFHRFYKGLIQFRKRHFALFNNDFLKEKEIDWHGHQPNQPDWEEDDHFVAFTLKGKECLYIAFNAANREIKINLPEGELWHFVANSSETSPDDFFEKPEEHPVLTQQLKMLPYSSLLLTT